MVFMAQKVKMCPPKYTKYKIDLTGQYTWKFENTPGQYGLKLISNKFAKRDYTQPTITTHGSNNKTRT